MKKRYFPLIPIASALLFSVAVYSRLPEQVAVHWNWSGEPDRWAGRVEGAFLMPAIMLVLWAALNWLPKIDPRRANYALFRETYDFVIAAVLTFMALIHVLALGAAIGWPIAIDRVVPGLVGALLVIVGNMLPRARSNWWFGIRTPWTLSSDRVWQKTHRMGGYLMMLAGLGMILRALVNEPWTLWLAVALIVLCVVGTIVYSYLTWREERRA